MFDDKNSPDVHLQNCALFGYVCAVSLSVQQWVVATHPGTWALQRSV